MEQVTLDNQEIANLLQRRASLDSEFSKDCWRWLCQQVVTVDEAADEGTARLRRWPKEKKYLQEMIQILKNERFVIIPKSRRMMVTWLVSAYFVHDARYNAHSADFIISETETKAAFVVDKRCYHIEQNLRHEEFRQNVGTLRTKTGLIGRMTYPNGSYIWGLASTGDALRTFTATKVLVDEIEFIDQGPALTRALIPLIENGAQAIFVSSSNGPTGIIAEYCRDVKFGKWEDMVNLSGEYVQYAS